MVVQIASVVVSDNNKYTHNVFWVYRSNSEIGLWRYCSQSERMLYKGTLDYVQGTLIDLRLQAFLCLHAESLPFSDPASLTCFCSEIDDATCDTPEHIAKMDLPERSISNVAPFDYFNDINLDCGLLTSPAKYSLSTHMRQFSKLFEKKYSIMDETINLLFTYSFEFEKIMKGLSSVHSVQLQKRIADENLITNNIVLYFMKVKLTKNSHVDDKYVTLICNEKFHIFPFLMTPVDSKITYYGLYSQFIPCGLFICKLFDYYGKYEQCTADEVSNQRCTPMYAYIGTRYQNVFPINYMIEHFNSFCDIAVGGSRRKRRKKRTKKRI
jgi:hypothetical protein